MLSLRKVRLLATILFVLIAPFSTQMEAASVIAGTSLTAPPPFNAQNWWGVGPNWQLAFSFQMPTGPAYTVEGFQVAITTSFVNQPATFYLAEDASGVPGTVLTSFPVVGSPTPQVLSASPSVAATLKPGKVYWVIGGSSTSSFGWLFAPVNYGYITGRAYLDSSIGHWVPASMGAVGAFVILGNPQAAGQALPTGWATGVVVDPHNPSTVYAGGGVGVFKSTNGGQTWSNTNLPSNSCTVGGLTFDPSSSVLYVAASCGVFVTSDGAQTWTQARNLYCSDGLAVAQTTPSTLYSNSCGYGIYKSADGGQSFALTSATSINPQSLAVDPTKPSMVYAGTRDGVYKSIDSGQSWVLSSSGLSGVYIYALTVDSLNPTNVWAGTSSGLYKSTDGGQSWSIITAGVPSYTYVYSIAFDPFTHSTMYLGGTYFYVSTDSGQTWSRSNSGLPWYVNTSGIISSIAADPVNACVLYAATSIDSVYKSVNCGTNWFAYNSGIAALAVYSVEVDPSNSSTLYVGTNGSGFYKSVNGGLDWSNSGYPGGTYVQKMAINPTTGTLYAGYYRTTDRGQSWSSLPGSTPALYPANPSIGYAVSGSTIFKTTNDGQSWTSYAASGLPSSTIWALVVDPGNSSNLYVATLGSGVYKSADGGQTWAAANSGLSPSSFESIGFDYHVPPNLYAGATYGGLFKSTDGAQSWSLVPGVPGYFFTALAFDPSNINTIYLGGFTGIAKTVDGGKTWTVQNSGLPYLYTNSVAIDPSNTSTVYAGTMDGLYKSTNGGGTWQPIGSGASVAISVTPSTGVNNQTISVIISGSTKLNGAVVKLSASGTSDINGTGISNPSPSVLDVTFNLSSAAAGTRNVVITASDGSNITLYNAFTVTQAPPCTYIISPSAASIGSSGSSGSFIVNASNSSCGWSASSNASWITLPSAPAPVVSYLVAGSISTTSRMGTISINSNGVTQANFTITQAGLATCTYSLSSSGQSFSSAGGSTSVQVTATGGCSWSATGNPGWVSFPSGNSGVGNGTVIVSAQANAGPSRSATLTIAGNPFSITQAAATACGANDVSGSVSVSQGPMLLGSVLNSLYTRKITLTNVSGQTISGPIYLVLDGLPNFTAAGCQSGCGVMPAPPITHCQSPSAQGSELVLWSQSAMAPGQSIQLTITFGGGGSSITLGHYTTRVLSGTPNQ